MSPSVDAGPIDLAYTDDPDAGLAELRRYSRSHSASLRIDVKLSDQSSGWQEINRRDAAPVSQTTSQDGSKDKCPGW
jgi:hypothetical protein